jgi:hypothetical protein
MKSRVLLVLIVLFMAGCATNSYKEPDTSDPHAVFNTNAKLVPIEINGLPRSGMKLSNWTYRLSPGKVSMFVLVQLTGTLRAEGGLEFIAENQQSYEPVIENKLETVNLKIINSSTNEIVGSSELRKSTSSGGAVIPIVIPAN